MKYWIQQTFIRMVILFAMFAATKSFAHMMVAQHGTLNFVNNGAFMVLSLPVSGFDNIDDDNDGELSPAELRSHRHEIVDMLHEKVVLSDENGQRPLQGLIVSLASSHHDSKKNSKQLIVMGRFLLAEEYRDLAFNVGIFGEETKEQVLEITAKSRQNNLKQVFALTPEAQQHEVF